MASRWERMGLALGSAGLALLLLLAPARAGTLSLAPAAGDRGASAGRDLFVPITATQVLTDGFSNLPYVIGPGPGVLQIDDVIVDGDLTVLGRGENYGPIYVNGRLTISGTWDNLSDTRSVCDPIRDICVDSVVAGVIVNRGVWGSRGLLAMPYGVTNTGAWDNGAAVTGDGLWINAGQITNTGVITLFGTLLNSGRLGGSGLLVNQGVIHNTGVLTGAVTNHGLIVDTGVLSATMQGPDQVIALHDHLYLPWIVE